MRGPSKRGRRSALVVLLLAVTAFVAPASSDARGLDGPISFLENGQIRVGVDLNDGGKITYLAAVGGHFRRDLLQDSQQSYYGGPPDASWHVAASSGTVLANKNDGHTIYTKVIPQQDYPYRQCDCTFETWVTLVGNTVHVRNRLMNSRLDGLNFTPHAEELPAVYTTGDAYRLYTYDGNAPYTGGPVREITDDRGGFFSPGPSFSATEHWAALVNDDGFGVGLFEPRLTRFSGIPGDDYAVDYGWVNGYMTASTNELLGPDAVYNYSYTLVVGSLDVIRSYATIHRPDPRPVYLFKSGRQHWWEANASDAGDPIRGSLRIYPDRADPQLYGPETFFPAANVPTLYIRGAWHTGENVAQLFWRTDAGDFSESRSLRFGLDTDGRFHTYRLGVGSASEWTGTITGLRLDPVDLAEPGSWVDISCISWKPCPHTARTERTLARSAPPLVFQDSFDSSPNPSFWSASDSTPGTTADVSGGRLVLFAPFDADGAIGAGISSSCRVRGNYDIRVDYRLLKWPAAGGVRVSLGAGDAAVGRLSTGFDAYVASFQSGYSPPAVSTTDTVGSLRLVRKRGMVTAYYAHLGHWVTISPAPTATGDAPVRLSISSSAAFGHNEVRVAFDDFRVVRGRVVCG